VNASVTDVTVARCGYVETARGQLHYREAGRGAPIVLLHWTPGSSLQYAAVLPQLAAAGHRVIAFDLPGLGFSHERAGYWSIGDFAASILEGIQGLGIERCTLLGGHVSSEIALECALRAPQRVAQLILDGTPAWDEALRRSILDKATPAPMELHEDGAHLKRLWQHILWELNMWRPRASWSPELGHHAMQILRAKILAGFDMRPATALLQYDIFAALDAVRVPTLALTADDDPLRNCHETVLARVAAAEGHCFAGEHPLHVPTRAAEYAERILSRTSR
jgi:pimeloyl-ACP methyl ester carboxylesterase